VSGGSVPPDPGDWLGRGVRGKCRALVSAVLGANADSHGIYRAAHKLGEYFDGTELTDHP
jgi:hypothetical protein